MTKTKEIAVVSPELQKHLDLINNFKSQVDEVGNNLKQIKVVDEMSLAICQQNLSKANNILSVIEAKRKEIKEPYLEAGKLIDSTVKSIVEGLNEGITLVKKEVAEWDRKRLAEAKAKQDEIDRIAREKRLAEEKEQERIAAIREYISKKAAPLLKSIYESCVTVDICDQNLAKIEKNYKPRAFFQEFADEAYHLKDTYVDLIKAKRYQLTSANIMSEEEREIALEKEKLAMQKNEMSLREAELKAKEDAVAFEKEKAEAEAQALLEKERIEQEALANKTKGIRYNWGIEMVDKSKMPLDWLTIDEAAVKEYIKANKATLTEGELNGVRFFKKPIVVS